MQSLKSIIIQKEKDLNVLRLMLSTKYRYKFYENHVHMRVHNVYASKLASFQKNKGSLSFPQPPASDTAGGVVDNSSKTVEKSLLDISIVSPTPPSHHASSRLMRDYIFTNYSSFNSFTTLTFRSHITDPSIAFEFFQNWIDSRRRAGLITHYIGTWELTKKGRIHFHLLTNIICFDSSFSRDSLLWRHGFVYTVPLRGKDHTRRSASANSNYAQIHRARNPSGFQVSSGSLFSNTSRHIQLSILDVKEKNTDIASSGPCGLVHNSVDNSIRVANYLTKYLTKGDHYAKNQRKVLKSRNLRKPEIILGDESLAIDLDYQFKSCYYDFINQSNVDIFYRKEL